VLRGPLAIGTAGLWAVMALSADLSPLCYALPCILLMYRPETRGVVTPSWRLGAGSLAPIGMRVRRRSGAADGTRYGARSRCAHRSRTPEHACGHVVARRTKV
jgi:hypothetical protein